MLHPDDIARLCLRKYPGFLASVAAGEGFFPLEIRFGRPSTTAEWEALRIEIGALAAGDLGYCIEWAETNTRRWGRQKFPQRVWFENETDFLRAIRKTAEVARFRDNLSKAKDCCPEVLAWVPVNVMRVVEYADDWEGLLKVCRYFRSNPRPGLYARELPIDVDTKFVERHEGVLRSLLDFLLPGDARRESARFEDRFGLRYDEPLVRFRLLDRRLKSRLGLPMGDAAVPLSEFQALDWSGLTVLVAENKMTFLTLPEIRDGVGVWGGGGAAELLASVNWLTRCRLLYWGDVDVHGFHILSRLRRAFPSLTSVMMNEQVLDQFAHLAGVARAASYEDVAGLTDCERRAYERVRAEQLLLEQEKLPQSYVRSEILLSCGNTKQ